MKKILIGFLLTIGLANAGIIFLGYEFNMDKSLIPNLKKIENTETLPKPLDVYINDDKVKFVFLKNKLKMVNITYDKPELEKTIANILKDGYRLSKIDVKTKYGKERVKNVGELLAIIEKVKKEAYIFDSFIDVNLKFQNMTNGIVILSYKNYMKRESLNCRKCEEVKGKKNIDFEVLNIYFSENNK